MWVRYINELRKKKSKYLRLLLNEFQGIYKNRVLVFHPKLISQKSNTSDIGTNVYIISNLSYTLHILSLLNCSFKIFHRL